MDTTVLLTAVAVMLLAGTLTIAVWRSLARPAELDEFDQVLARVTGDEIAQVDTALNRSSKGKKASATWSGFWLASVTKAGRPVKDPSSPGRIMIGVGVAAFFFGSVAVPPVGGLLVAPLALLGVKVWLSFEEKRRKVLMERQMPLLLSGLRTQMHAGMTAQSALMQIADDLPAPLGEEMRALKQDVQVGVPLEKALDALAARAGTRIMKFLVSSIGVALQSGSDLVPQLITIEEIVRQRARIDGKIRSAVALARPTALLAQAAPVGMAAYMAFSDETWLPYMFGPGLFLFLIAVALYAVGVVLIRTMVANVEKI